MERWYEKTRLWGQVNLTEMDPQICNPEEWKEYWEKTGVEGVIINCSGIVSYYPGGMEGQYQAAGLKGQDYFGSWSRAARDAGLRVIARMDINCTNEELYLMHPEWYCRDNRMHPVMSQGRYVACVNGGYYRTFIPAVFKEVIERYHPDGFADNSWAGPAMKTICYCENCRRAFREAEGEELPDSVDWENSTYRKWVRWNFGLRVKIWEYFDEVTRVAGGEACRWFGMINADPFDTGGRFYDLKRLAARADFVFCDHQARGRSAGFEQNVWHGSLLKTAGKENMIVAESMAHYYKGLRTFRLSSASRCEVRKWMLSGIAGGISPWFHFIGGRNLDRRRLELSDDIFRWMKENRTLFSDRINAANVGVVWNQESAVYYGRDEAAQKSAACFYGMTESLSRAGIPFLPVHADDIAAYAKRLELLILPNVAILSQSQEQQLAEWLKKGKHLFITDDTGLYDADGEWKGAGLLYELLGIEVEREMAGSEMTDSENWMRHEAHSYLELTQKDHPLFGLTPHTDILPFGGQLRITHSDGTLDTVAALIPAFPIYPPEFSWIREKSDIPAVYAGTLPGGSRVVYFPADLDRCYGVAHVPDHRKVLEGAVDWALQGLRQIRVSAPGHVNCSIYRKDESIQLHLVNLAGCNAPLGALEENLPVGPVELALRDAGTWKEAVGLWSKERFEVTYEGDFVKIRIPMLGEQELIVLHSED